MLRRAVILLLLCAAPALAAPGEAVPGPSGGLAQLALGLAVVVGLLLGAAWIMRRLNIQPGASDGLLKVRAATAVGQRERVVVVEVGETWLVVGVAPGRVTPLHTMARQDAGGMPAVQGTSQAGFPAWLRQALEKRS